MASEGKISVELNLVYQKAVQQARVAAKAFNVELGKGTGATDAPATKAVKGEAEKESAIRRTTSALQQQLDAWRKLNAGGIAPNQKVIIAAQQASKGLTGNPLQGQANTGGGLATSVPALSGAQTSMAANLQNRLKQAEPYLLRQFGMFSAAPALKAFGIIGAAAIAVGAAFMALKKALGEVMAAIENARRLYAKAVQSGFGIGLTVQRGMLAGIIGVSEDDIFQYGYAIEQLSNKIQVASKIIADTQPVLTATSWNWLVLKENMKAAWAQISAAIAPALNKLLELASATYKLAELSGVYKVVGLQIGVLIDVFTRLLAIIEILPSALAVAMLAIVDFFKNMAAHINNAIASTKIGKRIGFETEKLPGYQNTSQSFSALKEVLKAAFSFGQYNEKSNPMAYMRQLPASSWERMGLQIGGVGAADYARSTADNTKRSADWLQKLYTSQMNRKFNITQPLGMPSTP